MLIDFRVENFRSFRESQTLSMIASTRAKKVHLERCADLPGTDDKLLNTGVIWGANGAGKSNLFKAMLGATHFILEGSAARPGISCDPFRFSKNYEDAPSGFEFRFTIFDQVFTYGYAADATRVHEEWLLKHSGKKEQLLFERDESHKITIGALDKKEDSKIHALREVGTRANTLFLTSIHENIADEDLSVNILPVIRWFRDSLRFIGPFDPVMGLPQLLATNPKFSEFSSDFLSRAGTGVLELSPYLDPFESNELDKEMREKTEDQFPSKELDEGESFVYDYPNGDQTIIIKKDGKLLTGKLQIHAIHHSESEIQSKLPLEEESDGTRRLLHLIPALFDLARSENKVYVIDELDRSLHPNLSKEFIRYFHQSCQGHQRQLIVTTHEDRLLDLDLLRRDEIWFVEKGQNGASELRSLSDFHIRTDLKIDKGYLEGRFGGVPHIQGFIPSCAEDLALAET